MVRLSLSRQRRTRTGRKVHGSRLDKGGEVPLAEHLLEPGQHAWRFPCTCSVLTQTWELGSIALWLQVSTLSSINSIHLFSAMPGCECRYVSKFVGFFSLHIMNMSLV